MVFSSLPIYLDPANWTQQQHHHQHHHHQVANQIQLSAIGEPQHLSQQQQLAPQPSSGTEPVTSSGTARPNSMAERARLAKVPQPELALKCPRCESTNTKFCYFNNYSLSQPRHFCKTCRRYWTRGGSLRNVPVGGGCRRNKRSSKSGNSAASSKSSASTSSTAANCAAVPPHVMNPPPHPQLSFVALQSLADYGSAPNVDGMGFPVAAEYNSLSGGLDQWRFEQFPFYGGVENAHAPLPQAQLAASGGLGFPFDVGVDGFGAQVGPRVSGSLRLSDQLASVKMEDSNSNMLNLPRQFLGIPGSNHHYWGGGGGDGNGSGSNAGWPLDISAFNSSSSGNLL